MNETPGDRVTATPASATDGPVRQCALTRERLPQDALIRFVRSPDGEAVPDVAGKLPGRGAWVSANRESIELAAARGAMSRAFKQKTAMTAGAADLIEAQLTQRCTGLLGMARKSGQAVIGFDQVRAYLKSKPPGWLIEASDGAEDGRNKVHALARALYDTPKTAGALTSAELGVAFGRERVIHALLQVGALADAFGTAYRRLTGFRVAPEGIWFSVREQT